MCAAARLKNARAHINNANQGNTQLMIGCMATEKQIEFMQNR